MDGIQEITEIIEAYSGALTQPSSSSQLTPSETATVIGQTPSETIRKSIEKSFGEPKVGDYAALAYLSIARSAWRSSSNDPQCTSVLEETLLSSILHKKCAFSVLSLSVDILVEVAESNAAAKEHITKECMAAFTSYVETDNASMIALEGAAEIAARFFSGRSAVEAVVAAVCAECTTQQKRRMLVRVALGPLVEREENDKETLEIVWQNIIKTNDTQTILMVVGQLSKVFLCTHFDSYAHRTELWDYIYSALKNSVNDLYAKNCAIFLIGKYAECCGNPHEKELWDSFVIIWEAIGTHATELIKPAWKRLESIVRPGRDCYLEPRWPMLLFYCALNHYHVPIRRVLLVSFLTHGAYSVGVLATNVEFLENIVFKMFCDQALYKGELRPFSGKLIFSFLDSFFVLTKKNDDGTTAANVITAYLNALSSAPLFGASLLIHSKYLKSLLDGRFDIEADKKMIDSLVVFADKCTTSQHFVIRAHACRLLIKSLPGLLKPAKSVVTLNTLTSLFDALPRTELVAEIATLKQLVSESADDLLSSITSELNTFITNNNNNIEDWSRCDTLVFILALLPQAESAEAILSKCIQEAATPVEDKKMDPLAIVSGVADKAFQHGCALNDEGIIDALVKYTLNKLEKGAFCSIRCCAAWIRGFCANTHNAARISKLQPILEKTIEIIIAASKDVKRSVALTFSAILVLHAFATTKTFTELLHAKGVSAALGAVAPTMEVPLPKDETPMLIGNAKRVSWSGRLGEVSVYAWETLATLLPEVEFAPIYEAMTCPPSSAAVTATMNAVSAWVGHGKDFAVTPKELRKVIRCGLRMMCGEYSADRVLMDAWIGLAFHPALVQNPVHFENTRKLLQKILAYGQTNAFAVNRTVAQFARGIQWTDHYSVLEEAYLDELWEILVFGPNRGHFDGTYFMTLTYDDELLDEDDDNIVTDPKEEIATRAKDLRDHYSRLLISALILAAPKESRLPAFVLGKALDALNADLRSHMPLYSDQNRRQLRALQTVCYLAPRAGKELGDELAECLAKILSHDAYPPVRAFSLLAFTRLALADPERAAPLKSIIKEPGQKPFIVHAALTVWGTLLANVSAERVPALVADIVPFIIPHISGQAAVRTTAHCVLAVLLERGKMEQQPELAAVVRAVTQFTGASAAPSDADHMTQLVISWLSVGALLRCSMRDVFHTLPLSVDGYPGPDIASCAIVEDVERAFGLFGTADNIREDGVTFGGQAPVPIVPAEHSALVGRVRRPVLGYEIWGGEKAAGTGQVQRKPLPWVVGDDEEITRLTRRSRQDLILVASLVDKPPNLGGMCRTADIFNIKEYVIPDAKFKSHPQFQAVAVTSDHWVPISIVNEEGLPEYLAQKRKEGYTLFGVEQTNESVSLEAVEFPKRSLLLLGKEQQGIPANLIALLDACIEVPQLGIIRSLNVHVTAALVTWEYSKQHAFASKK